MQFPEDGLVQIQYKESRLNSPLQTINLSPHGKTLLSSDGCFKLELRKKKHGLSPLLIRQMGSDVFIENVSLNLINQAQNHSPISLHPSIPNSTSFHVFKQGYQSSSISNFRSSNDRNAWKYHQSSSAINPEQNLTDSMYTSSLRKRTQLMPKRGHINSDGMVCLEEILEIDNPEWGSQSAQNIKPQRRMLFYAGRPGQQFIRFFVHLDPKTGYLKEFNIIWDFSGRLLPNHGRVSLTPLSWMFENIDITKKKTKISNNPRRTCSHFIQEHYKKMGNYFHTKTSPKNHINAWCILPEHKADYKRLKKNLEAASSYNLKLSHFIVPECTTCNETGDPVSSLNDFSLNNISQEITRYGFIPAIRITPFLIPSNSKFFDKHPDMVLRNKKNDKAITIYNKSLNQKCYCLDTTHPRFRNWIKKYISILVKAGFKAIYLDQMTICAIRADYHNKQSSGAGRLRESLLWIKRAAGKKIKLLSSDCPLWPAIGLVDIMQISQDIGLSWQSTRLHKIIGGKDVPGARKSMINIINHAGMHNQLWSNAPGPFQIYQNQLTNRQRSMMMAILALSGGSLLFADNFHTLVEEEILEIKQLITINQECSTHTPLPLLMCEKHFPRGLYNPAGYMGIWNPTEHSERIELSIPATISMQNLRGKTNLWSKYKQKVAYRLEKDRFSIALSPYETILIKL